MNFEQIFTEYYTIFRGQATNIPAPGDREYDIAVQLANNAIRKWDRADGVEWKELWTTNVEDGSGDLTTASGVTEYTAPTNMRKPPAFISTGTNSFIKVVSPEQAEQYGGISSAYAYFTGSANRGFTLHFNPGDNSVPLNYTYLKKPTMITDATSKPDMSDPNFMIQDMLASRFLNNRNGFGYKIAKQEALTALQNMKIDNNSGTQGNSDNMGVSGGWGRTKRTSRII